MGRGRRRARVCLCYIGCRPPSPSLPQSTVIATLHWTSTVSSQCYCPHSMSSLRSSELSDPILSLRVVNISANRAVTTLRIRQTVDTGHFSPAREGESSAAADSPGVGVGDERVGADRHRIGRGGGRFHPRLVVNVCVLRYQCCALD